MTITSYAFLLVFLPCVVAACRVAERVRPGVKPWIVAIASLGFYAAADPAGSWVLVGSLVVNYVAALLIVRQAGRRRRWLLAGAVAANVMLLAAFKLGALGQGARGAMDADLHAMWLPLGLSFFTIQQITFLADVAAPGGPAPGILPPPSYIGCVAFFPSIASGPILRYRDAAPQWKAIAAPTEPDNVACGLSLTAVGLAKILLLAQSLAPMVDRLFAAAAAGQPLLIHEAWLGAWGSLMYLYFNFSGYSDVAIGIGRMLGFRLPINFNSPLKARSLTDLLDRWHMSLIAIIRAYLFTPLYAFLRRRLPGRAVARSLRAWAVATFISFVALGLWHSVSPPFIVSAVLVSLITIAYQLTTIRRNHHAGGRTRHQPLGHLVVVVGFTLFAILTRVPDLGTAWRMLASMVDTSSFLLPAWLAAPLVGWLPRLQDGVTNHAIFFPHGNNATTPFLVMTVVATAVVFRLPSTVDVFQLWDHPGAPARPAPSAGTAHAIVWRPSFGWALVSAVLLAASLMAIPAGDEVTSIYAQY